MIDRTARDLGANIVRRFASGDMNNDEFEEAWPSSEDPALRAVASMAWGSYSDNDVVTLTGKHALTPEARSTFERMARFLETDLPYDWPSNNFYRIAGVGRIGLVMTLGLLWPVDWLIKRANRRFEARMAAVGDMTCWPFLSWEDVPSAPLPSPSVTGP